MIKEINFSKKAVERINQLISKRPSGTFFRIAVKGGGCSGFKYDFTFDNKIDVNDLKHENIVVDKSSLDMLKGSLVDFSEELIGTSFKISNRKTKSSETSQNNKFGIRLKQNLIKLSSSSKGFKCPKFKNNPPF